MKNFLLSLLDWIYKKRCYFCGNSKESVVMCSNCYEKMLHSSYNVNRLIFDTKIYACGIYETVIQKLIRGLKYHNQRELAYYQAKFMWEYWKNIDTEIIYQVIPVPIFELRKKQRKYNHMELVAEEFCKLSGYDYNPEFIMRIKDTKPQYRLKRSERMENLNKAFKINDEYKKDLPILLIDDICTTGSTFESIIQELHNSGIYNITCLATSTVGN
ncbi:MAG: ComF family protein [Candidatus Gastranaerophilaceae bacterium]